MNALVEQMHQALVEQAERSHFQIFPMATHALKRRLRGAPIRDPKTRRVIDYDLPDLDTIELAPKAMGRLREDEAPPPSGDTTNFNGPTLIQSREDAIAAMRLIADRREQIEREKQQCKVPPIDVTATEVGSA